MIYTASLSKYADPLLDLLDKERVISKRLFREHCVFYDGENYFNVTIDITIFLRLFFIILL